jgi:hypothetical protein
MPPDRRTEDKRAKFWRELGLLPGAPDCVIKAAHRCLIEIHHPDRGGSDRKAKAVNIARDEVLGEGMAANEYVAQNYTGEPWHVLGLMANAERDLVERAGRALVSELTSNRRLVARIEWAVKNFGKPATNGAQPAAPPPQPSRRTPIDRPAPPRPRAAAGTPEGLVERIDFGTLPWRSDAKKELRLTWRQFAPYKIGVDVASPLIADVIESKALPGRFIIALTVDWDALDRDRSATVRGYTLDAALTVRWPGDGEAVVRVRGVLHFPATVFASPNELNLGTVALGERKTVDFALLSNASATVAVEPCAWLARSDASGRAIDSPIQLAANTPYRVPLLVDWAPIRERGAASLAAGRPVRPTGKIVVRWGESTLEIPVEMVVKAG